MLKNLPCLDELKKGSKVHFSQTLSLLEKWGNHRDAVALLDQAYAQPRGHVVGFTGPPGVGKSTLVGAFIEYARSKGKRVGCIAVDPSSRVSGGALLGDRARIDVDPNDQDIFIRSMAARGRLGGVSDLTLSTMVLMRALYDFVFIETVGVGQSETDISTLCDTVIFCVQPGSGDALQFIKSGIMEIPHVCVVTKADMEKQARRCQSDMASALALQCFDQKGWSVPVKMASVRHQDRRGVDDVYQCVCDHFSFLKECGTLAQERLIQAREWINMLIKERFGTYGLEKLDHYPQTNDFRPFEFYVHFLQDQDRILSQINLDHQKDGRN